jgi:tetratricopeptide (TPR) repeat protein
VLARFGEDIGAVTALIDRALALNPSFARGWFVSGLLRLWAGQRDLAIEHVETSLRLSPRDQLVGDQATFAMAMAHFIAGRYLDCVASARGTIERYPEYVPAHYALIAALAMQGEQAATAQALATVLQLRPDISIALLDKNMPWTRDILVRLI